MRRERNNGRNNSKNCLCFIFATFTLYKRLQSKILCFNLESVGMPIDHIQISGHMLNMRRQFQWVHYTIYGCGTMVCTDPHARLLKVIRSTEL